MASELEELVGFLSDGKIDVRVVLYSCSRFKGFRVYDTVVGL